MDNARAVGTDRGKEVRPLEAVYNILEFLAIPSEEDCACARSISDANNVALNEGRAILCPVEWLVISAMARGCVCNRVFMES